MTDTSTAQPVAYLWQHTITGQTKALMRDAVFTAGPHWRLVGPLHLATESWHELEASQAQCVPQIDWESAAEKIAIAVADNCGTVQKLFAGHPTQQGMDAEYQRGYQDGYKQRDAEVRGALL